LTIGSSQVDINFSGILYQSFIDWFVDPVGEIDMIDLGPTLEQSE